MPAPSGAEGSFYIDRDAWTCPHCGWTYRRPQGRRYPGRDRRYMRDAHRCPEVLPR